MIQRYVLPLVLLGALAIPAMADEPPPADDTAAPAVETGTEQQEWQEIDPSESKHKENLSGVPFMAGAYMVILVGIFLYIVSIHRRQTKVDEELARLRAQVEERGA